MPSIDQFSFRGTDHGIRQNSTPQELQVPISSPLISDEYEDLEARVYARLRKLILERRIAAGERIYPDRWARVLGVSRTPVLHALKRLAHEQIVEWTSRRGIYLKIYTKRELARLLEVREALERGLTTMEQMAPGRYPQGV